MGMALYLKAELCPVARTFMRAWHYISKLNCVQLPEVGANERQTLTFFGENQVATPSNIKSCTSVASTPVQDLFTCCIVPTHGQMGGSHAMCNPLCQVYAY